MLIIFTAESANKRICRIALLLILLLISLPLSYPCHLVVCNYWQLENREAKRDFEL